MNTNNNYNSVSDAHSGYPILGVPQQVDGGVYIVKNRAVIGIIYTIKCPKCQKNLYVQAQSVKAHKTACKGCGTPIYFIGKEVQNNVVNEQQPEKLTGSTEKVSREEENNQNTKKNEEEESKKTEKFGKPNAKFVWGSVFNRKSFEIKRMGEYYIGRDDDEMLSDVSIHDDYVSRRSIVINVIPKEGSKNCNYKMTVMKASNPVRVNGQEIVVGGSVFLNYGDTILVGNTTLTFKQNKK